MVVAFLNRTLDGLTRHLRGAQVTTPTILQMDAAECGAACLAIILGHFGRWIPLEELRQLCGVSRDGAKALNIVRAARQLGLDCKGLRIDVAELRGLQLPVVVYWNFNHFVVIEGFGRGGVYLNDPAMGHRFVENDEFSASYTGIALTFAPGQTFTKAGKPPRVWSGLMRRIGQSRGAVAFITLISLLLVIPGFVIPAFSRIFIDQYLIGGQDGWVKPLLWCYALALLISLGLSWLQQHYLLRLETKLALTAASRMMWHLFSLPIEYFAQRFAGDLASRVQANSRVAQLLSGDLTTNAVSMIAVAFYAVIMLAYNVPLALIAIFLSLANLGALKLVWRRLDNANRVLAQNSGKLMSVAMGGIVTIETLKAQGGENDFFARWAGLQAQQVSLGQEIGRESQVLTALPALLAGVSTTLILGLGAVNVMDGAMTIGDLIAFQALAASFAAPIRKLVNLGAKLQRVGADLTRIDDVFNYRPRLATRSPTLTIAHRTKLVGAISITDVSFGYSRLDPPLIRDFNLTVAPGRRVAIVGASGSGKSTLIKVLSGLYQPWRGDIRFDGVPMDAIDPVLLRNSIGVVDQDIYLFGASVRDNLTLWDQTIPDGTVVEAARDAGIHPAIMARAGGYNALVAEGGGNFSGGERQRLEIARALANQPSILLLDEATAALDPVTEKLVDDAIRRRGCTTISVAHRLSTIRDADEIIVLKSGVVVQRGTHEALKDQEGEYARLIASQ